MDISSVSPEAKLTLLVMGIFLHRSWQLLVMVLDISSFGLRVVPHVPRCLTISPKLAIFS